MDDYNSYSLFFVYLKSFIIKIGRNSVNDKAPKFIGLVWFSQHLLAHWHLQYAKVVEQVLEIYGSETTHVLGW